MRSEFHWHQHWKSSSKTEHEIGIIDGRKKKHSLKSSLFLLFLAKFSAPAPCVLRLKHL
jgi:hypothetical protein